MPRGCSSESQVRCCGFPAEADAMQALSVRPAMTMTRERFALRRRLPAALARRMRALSSRLAEHCGLVFMRLKLSGRQAANVNRKELSPSNRVSVFKTPPIELMALSRILVKAREIQVARPPKAECLIGNCCSIASFMYDGCGLADRSAEPWRRNSGVRSEKYFDHSLSSLAERKTYRSVYPGGGTLREFTRLGAISELPECGHARLEQDGYRVQVNNDTAGGRQPHVALRSPHARWRIPGAQAV